MTSDSLPRHPVKLSVVVPCYQAEPFLRRCLDSLLGQTMDGIEIIGVNDGSRDGTLEILREYEREHPGRVRVVDKPNGGLWNARWSGTDVARGDYVAYVDSDDYVDEGFARDLYETAVREDADIVVCGFRRVDETTGATLSQEMDEPRPPFDPHTDPGLLVGVNPAAWNKCFSRELLSSMYRLAEPPLILEDLTLSQLAYLSARRAVAFTGTAPYNYVIRDGSMINSVTEAQVESVKRALLEVRGHFVEERASEDLLSSLDATAFLHLGVSMSFRLSCSERADLRGHLRSTTRYLDENFPTWRRSPYITARYAATHGSAYLKLYVSRLFFRAHLMGPFLSLYRLYLSRSGKDLKW